MGRSLLTRRPGTVLPSARMCPRTCPARDASRQSEASAGPPEKRIRCRGRDGCARRPLSGPRSMSPCPAFRGQLPAVVAGARTTGTPRPARRKESLQLARKTNSGVRGLALLMQRRSVMTNCLGTRHELALYFPDVKAGEVKLRRETAHAHTLHDRLSFCYRVPAAVTGLPIAGTAPDTWHSVVRKTALVDLSVNEKSKHRRVHGMTSRCHFASRHARFTGVSAPVAPTRRPRCRPVIL